VRPNSSITGVGVAGGGKAKVTVHQPAQVFDGEPGGSSQTLLDGHPAFCQSQGHEQSDEKDDANDEGDNG